MDNICGKCNNVLSEGDLFCPYCGNKIIKEATEPVNASQNTFWEFKSRFYPKASNGRRLAAYLIDSVISILLCVPGLVVIFLVLGDVIRSIWVGGNPDDLLSTYFNESFDGFSFIIYYLGFYFISLLLICAPPFIYSSIKDGFSGQSIGKMLVNIIVIDLKTNKPCDKYKSFLRSIIPMVLSSVTCIGWIIEPIMVISDTNGMRIGDKIADTQVVDMEEYYKLDSQKQF